MTTNSTQASAIAPNGKAVKTNGTFKMSYGVAINIKASAETVWKLLTNAAEMPSWNSTLVSMSGTIAQGEKVQLVAKIAPDRTFKIKVEALTPNQSMVWADGFAPMFRGVRTFTLTPNGNGGVVFTMVEVYRGLMLPMIKGSLPDFTEAFETYAADLKAAAE